MELETVNKLYLELSQFATAKTARELELQSELTKTQLELYEVIINTKEILYRDDISKLPIVTKEVDYSIMESADLLTQFNVLSMLAGITDHFDDDETHKKIEQKTDRIQAEIINRLDDLEYFKTLANGDKDADIDA